MHQHLPPLLQSKIRWRGRRSTKYELYVASCCEGLRFEGWGLQLRPWGLWSFKRLPQKVIPQHHVFSVDNIPFTGQHGEMKIHQVISYPCSYPITMSVHLCVRDSCGNSGEPFPLLNFAAWLRWTFQLMQHIPKKTRFEMNMSWFVMSSSYLGSILSRPHRHLEATLSLFTMLGTLPWRHPCWQRHSKRNVTTLPHSVSGRSLGNVCFHSVPHCRVKGGQVKLTACTFCQFVLDYDSITILHVDSWN